MSQEQDKSGAPKLPLLFTPEGKPLRVLSTSLGIALLANALYAAGVPHPASAASAQAGPTASSGADAGPALTEWSSDAVKAYFDPSVDWNIPMPEEEPDDGAAGGTSSGTVGSGGSGGTTVIHHTSGFGWDDLLLYHLIFNRGGSYSSGAYYNSHPAYDARSGSAYRPRTYGGDTFRNKAVVGSAVRPKTSDSSGSITRRSTSSSKGGIGGKSSGFGSSGSSSKSSGGFGG
ncbi:hypothetical protein [Cohnella nanjingensis]|uniref:Uncharacterized protein n=1 Tax=Cohnella nanjingensis TaxID=1387779 RepID=A0A7X0VGQ4_9BACL|nr:hypothetical protein [Cohnella nanjingensis]MBB6673342.1 hypothetical protein [Cohnella nanjingensis]